MQTDLWVWHEIKVSKDSENYRLVFEGNATNLFNEHSATSIYQCLAAAGSFSSTRVTLQRRSPIRLGQDYERDDYLDAANATGAFAGVQTPLTLSTRCHPRTFQLSRQFRFAVRFMF